MIAFDSPPPMVAPAPVPSRNVLIWGDKVALEAIRFDFEARGWMWATLILGEKSPALMLKPPQTFPDDGLLKLISEINAGKFGKVNAGFGLIDFPTSAPTERGN